MRVLVENGVLGELSSELQERYVMNQEILL